MGEQRRLQEEERERIRKEKEEQRLRQEQETARKLEERRREEQAQIENEIRRRNEATLAVLRSLKNLSTAGPGNVCSRRLEVEQVLIKELPLTGKRRELLQAEAQRLLEAA